MTTDPPGFAALFMSLRDETAALCAAAFAVLACSEKAAPARRGFYLLFNRYAQADGQMRYDLNHSVSLSFVVLLVQ